MFNPSIRTAANRALVAFAAALGTFALCASAQAAVLVQVWPNSGWNTFLVYPSSTVGCPSPGIVWQHSVATQFYDDRVSNPNQLWIDYYDVYAGTPTNWNYIWYTMVIYDEANPANTGYYAAPSAYAFYNDWTVWPQRSFGYKQPPGNQVSVQTEFNVLGSSNCGDYSVVVFRH
jgi:hypothetical protein